MAIKKVKLPDNTTVDLNDARIGVSSPSNGQVLAYNSTSQKFENQSISTGGGDVYFGDGAGSGAAAPILSGVTFNGTAAPVVDGVANITAPVSNEVEIVNFTVSNSNGTYTVDSCDTSLADIIGYVNAGKEVIGVLTYSNGASAITRYSGLSMSGIVIFASSPIEYDQYQLLGSSNGSSDVWVMYVLNIASPGTLTTTSTSALSTASNEALSGSISLHKVAKTGTYSDLIGTPTIPTVNNSTITIQKNGATVDSFTTNASSGKSINITVSEPPSVSSSDNGKVMVVSSGAWAAVKPVTIYSGSSAPSSGTGSDGDIYIQTES